MPPLSSAADVRYELDRLRPNIHLEETEETWDKIAKALQELIKICEDGAYDVAPSELVSSIKTSQRPIVSAMNSERTRLCMVPMDLLSTLASVMGTEFEQLLPLFMPTLLALCARTNKVIINRAKASILAIIQSAQLASVLTYFLQNIKDKSSTLKVVIAEGTLACLNSCNPPDFEKEARATEVESIIRITARDANADVRKISRKIFESYKILLPSRIQRYGYFARELYTRTQLKFCSFVAPLSPTTKKYLDIKAPTLATQKSVPNLRVANLNSKPEPKASSSSSTLTAKSAHSRTASSSTVSTKSTGAQMAQQAATTSTLTRVNRKDPAVASRTTAAASNPASTAAARAPAPSAPLRPTQPSRVMTVDGSSRQRTTSTAQRPVMTTAASAPSRPLRSQPSIISRSTSTAGAPTSGGAQRIPQKDPAPLASSSQRRQPPQGLPSNAASSGPRRVPMPPPPPPPAPKKEGNNDGPKRPASRVDQEKEATNRPSSAASTSSRQPSSAAPPAPVKKKPIVSSLSSSTKGKAPGIATTSGHARSRSTVTASSVATSTTSAAAKAKAAQTAGTSTARSTGTTGAASTKPLAITKAAPAKPQWGARPAPAAKATSTTNTKSSSATTTAPAAAARGLVRKPSTKLGPASGAASQIAAGKGISRPETTAANVTIKRPVTPAQIALPPSPTPEEEEDHPIKQETVDGDREVEEERTVTTASSRRGSPVFSVSPGTITTEPDAQGDQAVAEEHEDVRNGASAGEEKGRDAQEETAEHNDTPIAVTVPMVAIAPADQIPPVEDTENAEVDFDESRPSTSSSSRQPLSTIASNPQTPKQNLLVPANNLITPLASKTPISALLSSIERGFQYDYSPITPLSPAANYLPNLTGEGTPYSHATHAPHRRFPEEAMQPFNHALHVVGHNGMFSGYGANAGLGGPKASENAIEKQELGVVPVPVQFGTELYAMPVALPGLDDGRLSLFDLNTTGRS
ncbi:hypothetical protein CVT26_005734 [Gymnopilus dilepis]|uniref:CLASP N-terminal domain-containing protein n=1 Tax=Gymnopilus dilepis TaxID=231916 RepID=A0A409VPC4_9AGAR|nr:hypothetical protein CVT26_005734 [Gymnopilus dilepis]